MAPHEQFAADLLALGWTRGMAGQRFGKDASLLNRMCAGTRALDPEMAAWARKHAQALLDDPPPHPARRVWRGGRRSRAEVEAARA